MRKKILIFIILTSFLLTGCWDMVEINNRIYPYSVGFDMDGKEEKYNITYSYPNINALGKNPTSQDKVFVVSIKADNLFHAIHHLSTRIFYPLDLKHLKVIILTEEVISDDKLVREIADGIMRDFIANKNAQLLVATEGAENLLQGTVKSKEQEIVGGTIYHLLLNQQESSFFTPITTGNFVEDIDISGSAIIPLGYFMDDAIHIEGGAVIKDYKLAGYITPKENRAIAHLNNKVESDGINLDYNGVNLSLRISESKTKKKLISRDENIKIQLSLEMEGHIHSFIYNDGGQIEDLEDNQRLERAAEKVVEKELQATVDKVQKDLKADVLFIESYLDKFHHKLWKEIEKDWDEIYPEIELDVEVDVKIRRRGLIK